jgi:hypothetical protein
MRPLEGVYDTICSVEFWQHRLYSMLASCSKTTLDVNNHGPLVAPGANLQLIKNIIQKTVDLKFDHASNVQFTAERQNRLKLPDSLPLGDSGKAASKIDGERKPAANTVTLGGAISQQTPKNTTATTSVKADTSNKTTRDFSAFATAGVTVPTAPQEKPKHLLCIADALGHYKVPYEDNTVPGKCTKKHDLAGGSRQTARMHVNEISKAYPQRYSLASAKFQACFWLNTRPAVASKLMTAMEADKVHFK